MNERVTAGLLQGNPSFREAVCIKTKKIYDSCRDKDCIEDVRVYLTRCGQEVVDRAINIKCRKSEIIWVYSDLEEVPFNRGFYTVDIKYFFRITLDVFTGVSLPTQVEGLATFDKKVILFGSEGNVRQFSSKFIDDDVDRQLKMRDNLPEAVVEVVDPICLAAKVLDIRNGHHHCDFDVSTLPASIGNFFDEELVAVNSEKIVLVSIGLFSIVKIVRDVQLLIPAYDFCVPENECIGATEENPCELFDRINFPVDEFFPPQIFDFEGAEDVLGEMRGRDRRGCR